MIRPSRDPNRPVKYLEWRVRLFGAGAILAIVGTYYDQGLVIWGAIIVLIVGFFLRFLPDPDDAVREEDRRSQPPDGA